MHGIKITEVTEGARSIATVATAVIGLVATAPAAEADAFPLNRPVLVTDLAAAIGQAGAGGTLGGVLQAIYDQVKTPVVVVRVEAGDDEAETSANVIGTTDANGVKTGMQALLAAEAITGVRPKILGAPGLDTEAVTKALAIIGQRLLGRVYAAANGATMAEAMTYRAKFTEREVTLIFGDFLVFDVVAKDNVTSFAAARALGLRAAIDRNSGWQKTLSNVAVEGVVGLTKDVGFDIQDEACEANLLNDKQIVALVRTPNGFVFWGNKTCAEPTSPFSFESAARAAQVVRATIGEGLVWAIDKELRPSLAKDIVETINRKGAAMTLNGELMGLKASFDSAKNTTASLSAGQLAIDYEFTAVLPLEGLLLNQRITDTYYADFATGLGA
jgi:uncharacterized protein